MTPGEAAKAGLLRQRLDALEIERDGLIARVAELEEALFRPDVRLPVAWRLTPQQTKLFGMLAAAAGVIVSRAAILNALYAGGEQPESSKLVDVLLSQLRRKLPPAIAIETVWGRGWRLPEPSRAALAAVTSEGDAAHRAASALYEAGRISRAAFFRRAEAASWNG